MASESIEGRFAADVLSALVEIFFFDPPRRGAFDRENHETLAFEGLTMTVRDGSIEFSLRVRERRPPRRSGTASVRVANPLPDARRDREAAGQLVETFVVELNEDLTSEEHPHETMNVLEWE